MRTRNHRHLCRRGAMLPLIAVLLPALVVFLGFAVDLAYMQLTRVELQAVTDAAARAGASTLSKTDDKKLARQACKRVARQNRVAGKKLKLANADIEFGRSERQKSGRYEFSLGSKPFNAVRVTGDRTLGSSTGAVSLFFGQMIGSSDFEPRFVTTASFLNVDLCLVIDQSTSMKLRVDQPSNTNLGGNLCKPPTSSSRWWDLADAIDQLLTFLDETNAKEQLALVTYAGSKGSAMCGVSSTPSSVDAPLDFDYLNVRSSVDKRKTSLWNGYTYIESGMATGLNHLLNSADARQSADKIMIVMTDGHENIGSAMDAANVCASSNVRVHTITFSDDADRVLMSKVATTGGGRHIHADNRQELANAFIELAAQASQLTE